MGALALMAMVFPWDICFDRMKYKELETNLSNHKINGYFSRAKTVPKSVFLLYCL